jgi:hypothetical protein
MRQLVSTFVLRYLDQHPVADYNTVEVACFEHFAFDWAQIRRSSPNPTRNPRHAVQDVIAEMVTKRQLGLI